MNPSLREGTRFAAVAAALSFTCAAAAAQPAPASPPPGEAHVIQVDPPARPFDSSPHTVKVAGQGQGQRGSAGADRFKSWRPLSLKTGQATLLIDGVSRTVKPGDSVDGYVLKSVAPDGVVLVGPAPRLPNGQTPAGQVVAIVTFDSKSGARVRMVFDVDPTAALSAPPPR